MIFNKSVFYLFLISNLTLSISHAQAELKKDLQSTEVNKETTSNEIYKTTLTTNEGKETTLKQYEGKVLLISNTASQCGFTYQYKDLQSLFASYKDKGFYVLGFPSNDFGEKEPGSDSEIKTFCVKNYGVNFPLFKKESVSGGNIQPLYKSLLESAPAEFQGPIEWNFEKIIVDKKGNVRGRFGSFVNPLNQRITSLIDQLLAE